MVAFLLADRTCRWPGEKRTVSAPHALDGALGLAGDLRPEVLRGLEYRNGPRLHSYRLTRSRIASYTGPSVTHLECAESPDLDVMAIGQRLPDRIKKAIDHRGAVLLRDPRPDRLGNLFDQIGFGHPFLQQSKSENARSERTVSVAIRAAATGT